MRAIRSQLIEMRGLDLASFEAKAIGPVLIA
jgi:hypothetical protein